MAHADIAERVVQIFAPVGANGLGRTGAGYLIGDGLMLTARHVIHEATGPCEARGLGDAGWAATTVLWSGDGDLDAALLRVHDPIADVDRALLGRIAGHDRQACAATGFPRAQRQPRAAAPLRRTEHLVGEVDQLSARAPGMAWWPLTIHVTGSVPEPTEGGSPWEGMSGAGLVCGALLVGVVIVDPARFGRDRLIALPLTRLVAAPGFAEALRVARAEPVVLEAVEAQGVLDRAYDQAPQPRARQSSSFLLGARYGVVAFRARDELDELRAWARGSQDVDVAVLTGAGGAGKSRLGRELCAALSAEHWVAGLLAHDAAPADVSRLTRAAGPLLVVVDYAETRADVVAPLLARLAGSSSRHRRRRLLLIARQLGDWWTGLRVAAPDGDVRELLGCAPAIELGAAEASVEDRQSAYREAAAAFASRTGSPLADAPAVDLSDRLFETLLFIHMAALGALSGGPSARVGSIREDLLARTLEREERYWSDSANALHPPLGVDEHVRRRAVAVATLTTPTTTGAPASEDETAALLEAVADLRHDVAQRRRTARWLHGLYAPSGAWVAPLEPDLLGEALVAQTLTIAPQLVRDLLGRADDAMAERALTVLTRGARHHEVCRVALADGLDGHLPRLAGAAVEVAQQLGDPLGVLLAGALDRHPDSTLARDLLAAIPRYTVSLREVAVIAASQALTGVPDDSRERAGLLVEQSRRLSEVGRLEDALAAIEEGVEMYWRVGEAGGEVFMTDMTVPLREKSERLTDLGRHEEALHAIELAVDFYRQAAEARPDTLLPDHATTLITLCRRLNDLGRREEALIVSEEAVALCRRPEAPPRDLALSLSTLSNILSALGRREDALAASEEAVAIHRLAPDTQSDAFRSDVAAALGNLSSRLTDLARHDEALAAMEESVAIQRRLADARPDAFLPDLAASLHYQSVIFRALVRPDDALSMIFEAITIRRRLADARPDAFLPDLAMSLSNASAYLRDAGRHEDALATIEEAVAILRSLADDGQEALARLAAALNNQAAMLRDVKRHGDALRAMEDAVAIRRRLAHARPGAFVPALAEALGNLATMLVDVGREEDACTAVEEALTIALPVLESMPHVLPRAGADLLQCYLRSCSETGRRPDLQIVLRMRDVLVAAGLIPRDPP